jgi:mRNA-degrading endonuclease RelE of RelBE toxin-antitoxin system
MKQYQSYTNDLFWKYYKDLPKEIQKLADKAYLIFKENPSHPGLVFKKVGKKQPVYSARVTDNYRALCVVKGKNAYWFWIGNHDSYEQLIEGL